MSVDADELVDVRDILARMHDARCGIRHRDVGLSQTEMAALRDCIRRLNVAILEARPREAKTCDASSPIEDHTLGHESDEGWRSCLRCHAEVREVASVVLSDDGGEG